MESKSSSSSSLSGDELNSSGSSMIRSEVWGQIPESMRRGIEKRINKILNAKNGKKLRNMIKRLQKPQVPQKRIVMSKKATKSAGKGRKKPNLKEKRKFYGKKCPELIISLSCVDSDDECTDTDDCIRSICNLPIRNRTNSIMTIKSGNDSMLAIESIPASDTEVTVTMETQLNTTMEPILFTSTEAEAMLAIEAPTSSNKSKTMAPVSIGATEATLMETIELINTSGCNLTVESVPINATKAPLIMETKSTNTEIIGWKTIESVPIHDNEATVGMQTELTGAIMKLFPNIATEVILVSDSSSNESMDTKASSGSTTK